MASPTPIVVTDSNGHALTITGATSGAQFAAPTPVVLTDVNGNALVLGAAASSGTVNSGTIHQVAIYAATGTAVSGDATLTNNGTTLAYSGTGGLSLSGGPITVPSGLVTAPSVVLTGSNGGVQGFWCAGQGNVNVVSNGTDVFNFNNQQIRVSAGIPFGFCSGTSGGTGLDTAISRDSAAVFDFGNGTQGDKSGTINTTALNVLGATATFGVAGATSGVLTLEGSASGSATITAPATAGTITNPIVFSNAITPGLATAGTMSTVAGAMMEAYAGAGNLFIGDGTNARRIPMTLYTGYSFAATGNATSLTSLFATPTGSSGSLTLVTNQQTVGSVIHIKATGTILVSTATMTINFSTQLNGGVVSALAIASVTTSPTFWDYEAWIYCSAVGAANTATMKSTSRVNMYSADGTTTFNITPAVTSLATTVATTGTQLIDLKMDFGTSETSNTCQMLMATVTLE